MNTTTNKLGVVQNLGLADRTIRLIVAAVLMGIPTYYLGMIDGTFTPWHGLLMLFAIYPAFTGMLGWDPIYHMTRIRSCSNTGLNQCGTLPYEIDAALGHRPIPSRDYDHSLAGSNHSVPKT
jgi:hypothetical protein